MVAKACAVGELFEWVGAVSVDQASHTDTAQISRPRHAETSINN